MDCKITAVIQKKKKYLEHNLLLKMSIFLTNVRNKHVFNIFILKRICIKSEKVQENSVAETRVVLNKS